MCSKRAKTVSYTHLDVYKRQTHDFVGSYGSAQMLLKRAPEGTGVIAGGPARAVIAVSYTHLHK